MSEPTPAVDIPVLGSLSVVAVSGPDARNFLQGQLSCDLRRLSPQRALLGSCNSAQGRVQALATLVAHGDTVLAVLASAVAVRFVARLRPYVLRSKVQLSEASGFAVAPLTRTEAGALAGEPPAEAGGCVARGEAIVLRWWGADERWLLLAPEAALTRKPDGLQDLHWRQAEVASGVPVVLPETSEAFVAQMLNLDVLGGISFDKGCYTGQEIIARAHYRGAVKRRLLRFAADCAPPMPGTRVLSADAHAGDVVEACVSDAGGCELLAVVSLDRAGETLTLDGQPGSPLRALSLPYVLPRADAADPGPP